MKPALGRTAWPLLIVAALAPPAGAPAATTAPAPVVHKLPASERAYELLVPPGSAAELRKLPLVVYLHGSKDPRLSDARRDWWPPLRDRRCLMVFPLSAGKEMWLAGEEKYVENVLADVQTRYSVDDKRIVLLGVSGGGQVALFLADRLPERFRAIVAVSTSPVAIRGHRHEWFYPDRKVLKTCPYLVVNHITEGSALMYWRQVQAKLAPAGASISVLPVTGRTGGYQPPPKPFGKWLDAVLAGKHPPPLPDPQKAAVAKMFAGAVAALPGAIGDARPAEGERIEKTGAAHRLALTAPKPFQRSPREDATDSTGAPMTQIRLEHAKWPIHVRAAARATDRPMGEVLAEEQAANVARGLLYQVYRTGALAAGGRRWTYTIGSITYPDRQRGWVSALFVHAAGAIRADPRRWLTVTVIDETQQPEAKELAEAFKTVVATIAAEPAPATRPAE